MPIVGCYTTIAHTCFPIGSTFVAMKFGASTTLFGGQSGQGTLLQRVSKWFYYFVYVTVYMYTVSTLAPPKPDIGVSAPQ